VISIHAKESSMEFQQAAFVSGVIPLGWTTFTAESRSLNRAAACHVTARNQTSRIVMNSGSGSAGGRPSEEEMQRFIQEMVRRKEEAERQKWEKMNAEGGISGPPMRHGEQGKFAPMSRVNSLFDLPRIVPFLGAITNLTPERFCAVPALSGSNQGIWQSWNIDQAKGQVIALPSEESNDPSDDVVCVLVSNQDLNVPFENDQEFLVSVNRSLTSAEDFVPGAFYLWDVQGELKFGHYPLAPKSVRCLGKMITTYFFTRTRQKPSGFAEFSDEFEF